MIKDWHSTNKMIYFQSSLDYNYVGFVRNPFTARTRFDYTLITSKRFSIPRSRGLKCCSIDLDAFIYASITVRA